MSRWPRVARCPASSSTRHGWSCRACKDRRAALDKVRREPEALIAPVDGVIADGTPVAGQMAQPNTVVFQIVDPARLWVEALSFDALAAATIATAQTAPGHTLALTYRGSGFSIATSRSRCISRSKVTCTVCGSASSSRCFAATGEELRGIALPRAAVVRSANGQDLVYEHVTAERFQPRPVRIEPLDGERVLIATGIAADKRIVVQGAELSIRCGEGERHRCSPSWSAIRFAIAC